MPYPFDQIFAADPERPEMVATNAPVVIFAPGDETKTPLTLTALNGLPLENPITVNDRGFGPAFIADLDQVAWEGGGLTGLLASYRGLKDDAVAARQAAEDIRDEVQAPTDEAVDRGISRANIPGLISSGVRSEIPALLDPTVKQIAAAYMASNPAIADAAAAAVNANPKISEIQAALNGVTLITNGSFRDGFTGWDAITGWNAEGSGITSWARAATGAAGLLTQSIIMPAYALGRSMRLKVLVNTTSTGTYRSRITTAAGVTDVSHVLEANSWSEKAVDIPIPANQGTTPITIQVGRTAGVVYMTSVRLEAL